MNPEDILSVNDMQKQRTVSDLDRWISEQCEKFTASQATKEYFREHRGLTKPLLEEIVPLARYTQAKYGLDSTVEVAPVIGDQSYDALIITESEEYKVEATLAIDGYQEHHRMKVLNENGSVSAWGKVEITGTKHTGYKYKVDGGGGSDSQIYGPIVEKIHSAFNRKIAKNYEGVRCLVIGFEDFLAFGESSDVDTFRAMLEEFESADKGTFASLWVVGTAGHFSAEFPAN